MANNFLPFCPTDTGTNLLSQSDYAAAADRTDGNQPGVASSKLNNKALRQSTYVVSQLAQFLSNFTGTDVLDDAVPAKLLAQINSAMMNLPPTIQSFLSSSGNYNATFVFFTGSASATVGATYSNNGNTYTVKATIASTTVLYATSGGAPTVSGTLTKTGGTGDSTITFYAYRAPIALDVTCVGGGGGGGASGTGTPPSGGNGGNSTWGSTLVVGNGGTGAGLSGAAGGSASIGSGPVGIGLHGAKGNGGCALQQGQGGAGANSFFGGGGGAGSSATIGDQDGGDGQTNTGGGGGGAGAGATSSVASGGGGGAGGYARGFIASPAATYAYAVGAAGTAASAGTSGAASGAGGSGIITVVQYFQ